MIDRIAQLLEECLNGQSKFPPTVLFNENWMLRLVLDWITRHPQNPLITVEEGSRWYSEGLMASAFLPRYRGDKLCEGFTHADGVLGHFTLGSAGRGDVVILPDARQFIVIEGKMFSPLSAGTRHAPSYDQAARNVACMANLLYRAKRPPAEVPSLAFILMAPEARINERIFTSLMSRESIRQKVLARAGCYEGQRDEWVNQWFLPTLEKINLQVIAWEQVLDTVRALDSGYAPTMDQYYRGCLQWNSAFDTPPK